MPRCPLSIRTAGWQCFVQTCKTTASYAYLFNLSWGASGFSALLAGKLNTGINGRFTESGESAEVHVAVRFTVVFGRSLDDALLATA